MITGQDILVLLPTEILAGGILLMVLLVAFCRNHSLIFMGTLGVLAASFSAVLYTWPNSPHPIGDLFLVDRFGCYFQALILFSAFIITVFSHISLQRSFPEKRKEEYYLLLLMATLGATAVVISTHFVSFFVGLEILNISLYTLISYYRESSRAIEAGLKYLILAATSSAFLLFGMALIYAITGTLSFQGLAATAPTLDSLSLLTLVAGIGMLITGMGFKLALVPFHMWAPDVYEGASSPISAFIATISKGAMMTVLIRFFTMTGMYGSKKIMLAFAVIAVLSMMAGSLLALRQNNIKRMLAYSSIANFGYVLVAFIAGKGPGTQAATFYITVYIIAILAAFSLITLISKADNEAASIEDYRGLFWRKPILAAVLSVTLLSLAGIPLTAGFMGKFLLLTAGVGKGNWILAFTLVVSSVIGLYYYLRFVFAMMETGENVAPINGRSSLTGMITLIFLGGMVIWLGTFPAWLISLIDSLA